MITKVIPEEKILSTIKLLKKSQNIVIVAHKRPDGDAIGSSLALSHFLSSQGKNTTVILPDDLPNYLTNLPGASDIVIYSKQEREARDIINTCDLVFCLDFNFLSRLGELSAPIEENTAPKVLLDHHMNHGDFANVTISHPEIASTSELVFRLICRMGYYPEMTLESAQCICTGMLTDTGGLAFNSNSPEIYTIMGELLKKGVDKDAIYRQVFNNYSENRMRLLGYVLYNKMRILEEQHTAIITLSYKEMQRFGYKPGDSEGFVNMPLSIDHVNCSVFIKEEADKAVKLSFRSQGDINVNIMAKELFGGGGHFNASGAESHLSLEDTEKVVVEFLTKNK